MRLVALDLERYGPFTQRPIRFREGARLHVVHGRNEAGKSTALAAITDLLFGFEHRTEFDFLHAASDLRVGARILGRGGESLEFRRRKGRRDTLIDANEKALPGDALAPYLGGLTRDIFTRAFGLSTRTLREGAQEMLRVDGDVGATLFAAASGLREPGELRRALNAEADAIFAPRASKERRFYQALESFEAARRAMRDGELRVGDWKELNERIAALRTKLEEIDLQRADRTTEHTRLQRLKRLAPLALLLDRAAVALDGSEPIPEIPLGFAQRLRDALDAEARAAQRCRECAQMVEELAREREGLSVDEALVARVGEVAELLRETGQYAKATEDLPGVDREAEGLRGGLEALAKRLGLAQAAQIASRQPSDADLALSRALSREGRAIEAEVASLRASLERERQSHASSRQDHAAGGGAPIDPEPVRERLAALAPVLRRLEGRADIEQAVEVEARAITEAALRLQPPVASLDELAAASLPAPETIARFKKELETLGKASDRASEEARTSERSRAEIEAALERLTAKRAVPSLDAIAAARAERETVWKELRAALFGAELSAPAKASSVASFEGQVAHADRLADETLSDAKRVAEHALQAKELLVARDRHMKAEKALAEAELREREQGDAWRAAWAGSGITPLPPGEMAGWSAAVAALLARRVQLLELRQKLCALDAEDRAAAPALRTAAHSAGLSDLDNVPSLQLAAHLEARLRRLSEAWEAARGQKAKLDAARERIEELDAVLKDASSRSAKWRERLRASLPKLGLPPEATLDEAEAALAAWGDVPEAVRLLAREERRVDGMRRDNAEFEKRVTALLAASAPDLTGVPFQIATKMLHERASGAAKAAARRDDHAKRLDAAAKKEKAATASLEDARHALASLIAEARLSREENLPALLACLDERSALEKQVREKRDELLRAADGFEEEAIRAELSSFDADAAEQRLSDLERERVRLDRESNESFAALDRGERRKVELETGVGAELAAQLRRNAEGELVTAARDWAVLKLGALILGTAIERHREAAQNPLLARAGELFRALTGGGFIGLASQYDDQDHPVLVGRRSEGAHVKIDGLSEGTRDQLYLALRLAYLERYAASLEPPPFIADDIFVTFDDERTGHGVAALAEIGTKVQCILFTHHRRTVEIAAERLGDEVDIIEL
jgi:uncharacterized protein YhaN